MIELDLRRELEGAAERLRRARLWSGLSLVWLAAALVGAGLIGFNRLTGSVTPLTVGLLAGVAAIAAVVCVVVVRRTGRDYAAIARRIERRYPDLDARLITALEQAPPQSKGQLGFLQHTVVREALSHARRHDWEMIVPERKLRLAKLAHAAALIALVIVLGRLLDVAGKTSPYGSTSEALARRTTGSEIHIEPGDASIERGTGLLVLARFDGQLPPDVQLLYRDASDGSQSLPMSKSLDDPLFAGRIQSVNQELTYAVRYGDERTRWYTVTVFDFPDLVRADAKLEFPDYTGMSETVVEDTRSVTAVEGTKLTFILRLNKPVADARLIPSSSKETPVAAGAAPSGTLMLTVDPVEPTTYMASLVLERSQRYRLHLTDDEGRKNKQPPELAVHVIPNRPAEVKLAAPARDVQVSPLEELAIKARVSDDFGLQRFGLAYSMAGELPQEIVLGEKTTGKERRDVDHLIALESLKAEPDQLLAYYFWAEDAAADGSVRRTSGDMYFAEVRPFEEIYRQGQQPTGEEMQQSAQQQQRGGQNAQRAEQLGELQKQIIAATWKLIRRESSATPSEKFVPDVQLVGESQASAREQAAALDERLEDPRSKAYLKSVLDHMDRALADLLRAKDGPAIDALKPALAAEQAAYQALLKLRAREHEVIRGNRQRGGGGGGGGGNRSQQQLDQLELADSQNRYETQRSAASQQSAQEQAEARETRQVLNRLRELAQRQEDLNRQMKELQTALEEARDQKQQEEIRRQLARLRDQQQQMLRDTDELRDRMDRNENQERMADARQQLDETRTNIRRASEALEEGQVSQAAAAGARAGEELNRLRDQFREANAGQFTDAMNEMREDARQLDEKQQQISERLTNLDQNQQRSLRDSGARRATVEELQQQKQDLQKLLENMRRTIEEAETSEPLLSKQLYDTARQARENQPEQALDVGSQLLDRGFLDEARAAERQAGRGIGELRKGVEQAADSVLGGDTEGLRRARAELDALAEQLNREISRARQGAGQNDGAQPPNDQLAQNQGAERSATPPGEQAGDRNASEQNGDAQQRSQQSGLQQRDGQQQGGQQQGGQQRGGQQQGDQQQSDQQQSGQQPGGQQEGAQQGGEQQEDAQQGDAQNQRQQGGAQQGGQQEGVQQQQGGQQQGGQQQGARQRGQQGGLRQDGPRNGSRRDGGTTRPGGNENLERFLGGTTGPAQSAENPLTGEGFREWTDRLRDVEEMVGDPRLRAEAARIRDRATGVRAEFKRHSKEPNWELVQEFIGRPLVELREAVAEELQRRDPSGALVPIDREPVPPEFVEQVRRYYERLGSGR